MVIGGNNYRIGISHDEHLNGMGLSITQTLHIIVEEKRNKNSRCKGPFLSLTKTWSSPLGRETKNKTHSRNSKMWEEKRTILRKKEMNLQAQTKLTFFRVHPKYLETNRRNKYVIYFLFFVSVIVFEIFTILNYKNFYQHVLFVKNGISTPQSFVLGKIK